MNHPARAIHTSMTRQLRMRIVKTNSEKLQKMPAQRHQDNQSRDKVDK